MIDGLRVGYAWHMKGTIIAVSLQHRMSILEVEPGMYSVVELVGGDEIELGDVISGDLYARGHHTLFNESRHRSFLAVIHTTCQTTGAQETSS